MTDAALHRKKNNLYLILSGIFITNALLAEIVGVKIFSLEDTLGLPPAQLTLFGDFVLDFNLTAGVMLWPVVFISTDVINEYFGKSGVKKISYLSAVLIVFAFLMVYLITLLSPAAFWLDINSSDNSGRAFDINFAFNKIFRQGLSIMIASLTAFLIGQLLDAFIFRKLRNITGRELVWVRATGSTLISQLFDSFIVLTIAFYILGDWSLAQVMAVGIINYLYKFIAAVILTPAIYLAHKLIDNYLGQAQAEQVTAAAARGSEGFF